MKKILVTGSDGFIGKKLVNYLDQSNLQFIRIGRNVKINSLKNLKFDICIHLAQRKKGFNIVDENLSSTLNLLNLSKKNNAKFIYISSYLYGFGCYQPAKETSPLFTHNNYALSKLICENLCNYYKRKFNLKTIILRPFNVYDESINQDNIFSDIIKSIKNKKKFVLYKPFISRDYLHVIDLVKAIYLTIFYPKSDIFNIASSSSISTLSLLNMFQNNLGFNIDKKIVKYKNSFLIKKTLADISHTKAKLKWTPKIKINQGVKSIILSNL